jgi:hypothetical protein
VTRGSRLRRARRVVAGGIVGGAVVLVRRRRKLSVPPARGGDPLEAFTSAPCYRERPETKPG